MDLAAYLRVSSEEQRKGDNILSQERLILDWAERNGHSIVAWYKDDGVSGTLRLDQRPDGKRLLMDAAAGRFEAVVVRAMDRICRTEAVGTLALAELDALQVPVRSVTEAFDDSPMGMYMRHLTVGMSAYVFRTLRKNMDDGKRTWAEKGYVVCGDVPYGYKKVVDGRRKAYVVDDDLIPGLTPPMSPAGVVRKVFDLLAYQGYNLNQALDWLNAHQVPTGSTLKGRSNASDKWYAPAVRKMVERTDYYGVNLYGKDRIERPVPAIVDHETWLAAQTAISGNRHVSRSKYAYLLTGLIYCGTCYDPTRPFPYTRFKGTHTVAPWGEYDYYVCGAKHSPKNHKHKCHSPSVNGAALENFVWKRIKRFIEDPTPLIGQWIAEWKKREAPDDLEAAIEGVKGKLRDKEAERERVKRAYRLGAYTAEEFVDEKLTIEREEAALQASLQRLQEQTLTAQEINSARDAVLGMVEQMRQAVEAGLTRTQMRSLCQMLVERITVYPNGGRVHVGDHAVRIMRAVALREALQHFGEAFDDMVERLDNGETTEGLVYAVDVPGVEGVEGSEGFSMNLSDLSMADLDDATEENPVGNMVAIIGNSACVVDFRCPDPKRLPHETDFRVLLANTAW